jgi:hypothetical protein
LEQYYHAMPDCSTVRIELHVGSYAPEFKWVSITTPEERSAKVRAEPHQGDPPQTALRSAESPAIVVPAKAKTRPVPEGGKAFAWVWSVVGLAVAASLVLIASSLYRARAPKTIWEQFWSPALASTEPVLICMAKPTVYLPSMKLYQRHSKTPGNPMAYSTGSLSRLLYKPTTNWFGEIWSNIRIMGLRRGMFTPPLGSRRFWGELGKETKCEWETTTLSKTFATFPPSLLGGVNNRWTMQITSNLHFAFLDEGGHPVIREQGPSGRYWAVKTGRNGRPIEDFGVVTRLLNSKTGQFVVVVAGIQSYGTHAAGELVATPEYLEKALRSTAPDWDRKNLQIVIQTTVTDSISGPPQIVAIYSW